MIAISQSTNTNDRWIDGRRCRPGAIAPHMGEPYYPDAARYMEMIHNAVTNQIHGKSVGTGASWSNPASQNSGSIRLAKKLVRDGQQCEDIDYTVRSGPPVYTEHYHLTSCLTQ